MKQLTKKQNAAFSNLKINKATLEFKSLISILNNEKGVERTGKSSYSGGYASKSIWTTELSALLTAIGIAHITGNDAPRGGASGEFVQVTDKRLLGRISKINLENSIENDKNKAKNDEKQKTKLNTILGTLSELPTEEQFAAKWQSSELKSASGLSWKAYREALKQAFPVLWAQLKESFKSQQIIAAKA